MLFLGLSGTVKNARRAKCKAESCLANYVKRLVATVPVVVAVASRVCVCVVLGPRPQLMLTWRRHILGN